MKHRSYEEAIIIGSTILVSVRMGEDYYGALEKETD
jgi:hypothetical protein